MLNSILKQQYVTFINNKIKSVKGAYYKPMITPLISGQITEGEQYDIFIQMIEEFEEILKKSSSMVNECMKKAISSDDTCYYAICEDFFDSTKGILEIESERKDISLFNINDYLGLAKNRRVIAASYAASLMYGVGGLGSRLIRGTTELHVMLEDSLSKFKGMGKKNIDTITFPSGYMANLALTGIIRDGDGTIIIDRKAHQSLSDGCDLAKVEKKRFYHNDLVSLNETVKKIRENKGASHKICIAVDGIYSMDGDISPLVEIRDIAKIYEALIILDDAHATGTLGRTGRGTLEYYNIHDWEDYIVIMGTLGKSLGGIGGFVTGRADFIKALKYTSNQIMFSTALTPPCVASALTALKIIEENPSMIYKLQGNTARLKAGIFDLGLNLGKTETHIIPIVIGSGRNDVANEEDDKTIAVSNYLMSKGYYLPPVIRPAVRKQRLRLSISAKHDTEQIDGLLKILKKCKEQHEL